MLPPWKPRWQSFGMPPCLEPTALKLLKTMVVLRKISMSVETILHNANIATNATPTFVEAVAISDGKIIATGTDEEILRLRVFGNSGPWSLGCDCFAF
jgi:hypothetical protein